MTIVSNDPNWWPEIQYSVLYSYFTIASAIVVLYDWALAFGQEYELVWKKRCSLMTVLYISLRYIGILTSVGGLLYLPSASLTDVGCGITTIVINWMNVVANTILGVIVITRLHAMYQKSRRLLICLVVIFSTFQVVCGVINAIYSRQLTVDSEELILSGYHICAIYGMSHLVDNTWILGTVWEVLTLCLAIWIAVRHFLELRRHGPSTGSIIGDCFRVLIKTHLFYFAAFAAVSSLYIGQLSPMISNLDPVAIGYYTGVTQIATVVQAFVLGPRLILSVRGYHGKIVADSDPGSAMTSVAFQGSNTFQLEVMYGGGKDSC